MEWFFWKFLLLFFGSFLAVWLIHVILSTIGKINNFIKNNEILYWIVLVGLILFVNVLIEI